MMRGVPAPTALRLIAGMDFVQSVMRAGIQ
jgi:hypothetical protein